MLLIILAKQYYLFLSIYIHSTLQGDGDENTKNIGRDDAEFYKEKGILCKKNSTRKKDKLTVKNWFVYSDMFDIPYKNPH